MGFGERCIVLLLFAILFSSSIVAFIPSAVADDDDKNRKKKIIAKVINDDGHRIRHAQCQVLVGDEQIASFSTGGSGFGKTKVDGNLKQVTVTCVNPGETKQGSTNADLNRRTTFVLVTLNQDILPPEDDLAAMVSMLKMQMEDVLKRLGILESGNQMSMDMIGELKIRMSAVENEVFCSGNGQYDPVNGMCECDVGFTGDDCSSIPCPNGCSGNGICENDGTCTCDVGFGDDDCSSISCPNGCNGNGICENDGTCTCDVGFSGEDCSTQTCPPGQTSSGGSCVPIICDDGLSCTDDSVDVNGQCVFVNNDTNCNDANVCTIDTCNPTHPNSNQGTGCVFSPDVGAPCGDQSDTECDNPDTCDSTGACVPNNEALGIFCSGGSCDGAGFCMQSDPELCDGIDNDQNSATPDGQDEPWFGLGCDGSDSDSCNEGTFSCVGGVQICSDASGDNQEVCNGLDDNCDGTTDEGVCIPPLINEILPDPNKAFGDPNKDGQVKGLKDEYIEIFNPEIPSLDLSGGSIENGAGTILHVFPSGTILGPGEYLVVFGNLANFCIPSCPPDAIGQSASTGSLKLVNSGDTITIKDKDGFVVTQATYDSVNLTFQNQSFLRCPNGDESNPLIPITTAVLNDPTITQMGTPGADNNCDPP